LYRIKILYPGKTKIRFIKEGIEHYFKLLYAYAKIDIIELKEAHGERQKVIQEESKTILNRVKNEFILLHESGQLFNSIEFAKLIKNKSFHQFVIGGAYGVNDEVSNASELIVSLSPLTFTHELTRLILLEQIYRAMTIIHGKSYHY